MALAALALPLSACIERPASLLEEGAPMDAALDDPADRGAIIDDPLAPDAMPPDGAVEGPDAVWPDDPPDPEPDPPPQPVVDTDGDHWPDADDPCPTVATRLPRDVDRDGAGDACDADDDGDGVLDVFDPCPWLADAEAADCAADRDADGQPDASDGCPTVPDPGGDHCPGPLRSVPWSRASPVVVADGDTLLVGTSGGVLRLSRAGVALEQWTRVDGVGPDVAGLALGREGEIWVGHSLGLSVIRPDGLVLRSGEDAPSSPVRAVATAPAALESIVWFTDDAGLWRMTADRRVRIGEPAVDVFTDGDGTPWRVDAARLERLERSLVLEAELEPIAPLHGGAAGADPDSVWAFGAGGAARIRRGVVERLHVLGAPVTAVVERDGEAFLGTDRGVIRVDRDGRALPPPWSIDGVHPPLPTDDVRALALAAGGGMWVGTTGGLFRLDGTIASFTGPELNCTTAVERYDGLIWLGTDDGLFTVDADGGLDRVDGVPGARITAIARAADGLWIGSHAGASLIGPDRIVRTTLTAGVELPDAPVSDIATHGDAVWIATDGGGLVFGGPGAWQAVGADEGLSSLAIRSIAGDGAYMWIVTPFAVHAWNHAAGALEPPWPLRTPNAWHVAVGTDGRAYAATNEGPMILEPGAVPIVLRRQTGGVPPEAGTGSTVATALDGEHLWVLTDPSQRQPVGGLTRRSPDPGNRADMRFWPVDALGAGVHGATPEGMWWLGDELAIAVCGERQSPGGLVLIAGRDLLGVDTRARRLPGGAGSRLVEGPGGWPLAIGSSPDGPVATVLERGGLRPIALPERWPAPLSCAMSADDAPTPILWCTFSDGRQARLDGRAWREADLRLPAGIELRDVATATGFQGWIATDRGLLEFDSPGNAHLHQQAAAGLIHDDVRQVRMSGDRVYAATAAGVSIYTPATDRWFDIGPGALPSGSTRATRVDDAGRLWIATDAGLAVFAADGAPLPVAPDVDLLDGVAVRDVAVDAAGRIYAASVDRLYVLDQTGGRHPLTPLHGVPVGGRADVVIDPDGDIWIAGEAGLGRLNPADLPALP